MTYQLDTTGIITLPPVDGGSPAPIAWSNLSPFAQGYIEALFASIGGKLEIVPFMGMRPEPFAVGFSDLAPETLARIIADCEAMVEAGGLPYHFAGTGFWSGRQAGNWTKAQPAEKYLKAVPAFPPLTVQLGDDGKVRFA